MCDTFTSLLLHRYLLILFFLRFSADYRHNNDHNSLHTLKKSNLLKIATFSLLHPNPTFLKPILEPKPNYLTALPPSPLKSPFTRLFANTILRNPNFFSVLSPLTRFLLTHLRNVFFSFQIFRCFKFESQFKQNNIVRK